MIVLNRNELNILKKIRLDIIKCFLKLFILTQLKNRSPLSGYDLVEIIHQQFGLGLSPGTVYSELYSMEREGLIKPRAASSIKNRKREYILMAEGQKLLGINAKFEDDIVSFVRKILIG